MLKAREFTLCCRPPWVREMGKDEVERSAEHCFKLEKSTMGRKRMEGAWGEGRLLPCTRKPAIVVNLESATTQDNYKEKNHNQ